MIQSISKLRVADNSGAKTVRCIKVLGGFKRKHAKLGEVIVVSVQNLRNKSKDSSKVKKKEVYKALIVKTKSRHTQKSGFSILLKENSVILLNKQDNPVGTRIIGPVIKSSLSKKYQKITALAAGII